MGAPVVLGKVTVGFATLVADKPVEVDQLYVLFRFGVAPIVTGVLEHVVTSTPALDWA